LSDPRCFFPHRFRHREEQNALRLLPYSGVNSLLQNLHGLSINFFFSALAARDFMRACAILHSSLHNPVSFRFDVNITPQCPQVGKNTPR
jgi:hypothetical protein